MSLPSFAFLLASFFAFQSTQSIPDSPVPQIQAPRPNPDANGVYHFEKGIVSIPDLIYSVEAEIPEKARKRNLPCVTKIRVIVDVDGHVREAQIIRSASERYREKKDHEAAVLFDQQALIAVRQYRYRPGMFQGKPVPVEEEIEVQFLVY